MKIVVTSDTHGQKPWKSFKNISPCDVFIIAGDLFTNHSNNRKNDAEWQVNQLNQFNDVCPQIPAKKIIVIAGNHDWIFQFGHHKKVIPLNFIYLQDEFTIFDNIKFYGMPWQPEFCDWAFNLPRGGDAMKAVINKIPDDTNVLITHGPPAGILDKLIFGESVGCNLLREKINKLHKLKLHIFGHIHYSYGKIEENGITFINAAMCTESYVPNNPMQIINI